MSEINVPAESLPQMPAAGVLSNTDLMYILQGSGLDRDRSITIAALLADGLFGNAVNANEHWRTYSITPAPSKRISFPGWTKNVLLLLPTPPFDTLTITSFLVNSIMLVCPEYTESSEYSDTITLILASNSTTKTVTIPNRSMAFIHYGADGTIVGVSFAYNDDAPKSYKVMTCGVSFADDGCRGPQEIIVRPKLTPDDGLLMTTAEILTYSENSVMKITPDWRHVVAQNSLSVTYPYSDASVTTIVPYGCSLEVAYLENQVVANIAVVLSFDYKITSANLADNAVTTGKINAGAVTDAELALNSVTELKIATGAVTENKHANLSVSTPKLQNGAATPVKVALTEGMEIALGTTAFDVDVYFPPANFHLGYILVLSAGDDNPITFSYQFANTTQTVTTRAYSAAMFVCVAQATQGHQWRPIGNYSL